ncbi:hypothetical protein AAHC03_013910 [Spirometra sp. Aus1]|nr:unnamed protein product [Spirometra erinaceieuropaei]
MASRNDGIQLLLQAEKAAAEKVAEAKRRKLKRLKEAKQEALTEIEIEKNEREKQYKALEDEVFGRRSGIQAQINQVTQKTLELQADSMRQHKDSAINMLLETVLSIEPRLHINFRPELSAVK